VSAPNVNRERVKDLFGRALEVARAERAAWLARAAAGDALL